MGPPPRCRAIWLSSRQWWRPGGAPAGPVAPPCPGGDGISIPPGREWQIVAPFSGPAEGFSTGARLLRTAAVRSRQAGIQADFHCDSLLSVENGGVWPLGDAGDPVDRVRPVRTEGVRHRHQYSQVVLGRRAIAPGRWVFSESPASQAHSSNTAKHLTRRQNESHGGSVPAHLKRQAHGLRGPPWLSFCLRVKCFAVLLE